MDPKGKGMLPTGEIMQRAKARIRGHLNYYAITDNGRMCNVYHYWFTRITFKWLNRRSQRQSYNWNEFNQMLKSVKWPTVRIKVDLNPFRTWTQYLRMQTWRAVCGKAARTVPWGFRQVPACSTRLVHSILKIIQNSRNIISFTYVELKKMNLYQIFNISGRGISTFFKFLVLPSLKELVFTKIPIHDYPSWRSVWVSLNSSLCNRLDDSVSLGYSSQF
jgi:hypothetical protein